MKWKTEFGRWRPWFAWFPVLVEDRMTPSPPYVREMHVKGERVAPHVRVRTWVWLSTVERRKIMVDTLRPSVIYDYRLPGKIEVETGDSL